METEKNRVSEVLNSSANQIVMPVDTIQELVDNYRDNQLACINNNLNMNDAHSIWFRIDIIKEFIEQIEHDAKLIDPQCSDKDLGIRFYYAAYPENPTEPIPQDYAKRHTLVMIPTKKKDDGSGEMLNYDFNPYDDDSDDDKNNALALTGGVGKSTNALAQNHGKLNPPGTTIVESY